MRSNIRDKQGLTGDPAEEALAAEFGSYLNTLALEFGAPFARMLKDQEAELAKARDKTQGKIQEMGEILTAELKAVGEQVAEQTSGIATELIEAKIALTQRTDEILALKAEFSRLRRDQWVFMTVSTLILIGFVALAKGWV